MREWCKVTGDGRSTQQLAVAVPQCGGLVCDRMPAARWHVGWASSAQASTTNVTSMPELQCAPPPTEQANLRARGAEGRGAACVRRSVAQGKLLALHRLQRRSSTQMAAAGGGDPQLTCRCRAHQTSQWQSRQRWGAQSLPYQGRR